MPINFHSEHNRQTYTNRSVDPRWKDAMLAIIDPMGMRVADIGCGGGIYTRAWAEMGAIVTGLDFSSVMINSAREYCADLPNVSFRVGDAMDTGFVDQSFDLVFERALIHHLSDLRACFAEVHRVLCDDGLVVIQDRTPADVQITGSPAHLRGYFVERYPRLMEFEIGRRSTGEQVRSHLRAVGFLDIREQVIWETRRVYESFSELADDLQSRTGRSILHELDDEELYDLISYIGNKLPSKGEIKEQDRWTAWTARKK